MGNQNEKKQPKKPKRNQKPIVMSFSKAEKERQLIKWREDMYIKNQNKKIDYPNKLSSLNTYLYQCLYVSIKYNAENINLICPYCLKTENQISIINPEAGKISYFDNLKDIYIEDLLNDIKQNDKRFFSELDLLKRYSKECKHFFHSNCIEKIQKKGDSHKCFYCQYHINAENLKLFDGFINYEELGTYVSFFQRSVKFDTKKQYHFIERILEKLRSFIKNDERLDLMVNGFQLRRNVILGDKYRSLGEKYDYKYTYSFCIDSDEFSEENYKKEESNAIAYYEEKMKREKEREERRRKRREERERERERQEKEEEEEEEYNKRYNNTTGNIKKRDYKMVSACFDCCKRCFNCGKKDYPLYFHCHYAHLDCFRQLKGNCVVCRQKCFDVTHGIQCCKSCLGKINNKNCILCNEAVK